MAKKQITYDYLSQIDNCLSRYYYATMAPTLAKEKKLLEERQSKEYKAARAEEERKGNTFFGAMSDALADTHAVTYDRAKAKVDAVGKWNTKTLDDLFSDVEGKWLSNNKLQEDIKTIKEEFYAALCQEKGVTYSKELATYTNNYVDSRIQNLMVEQLARLNVPKSSAEYIVRKGWNESLLGLLAPDYGIKGGIIGSNVSKKAEELYRPSTTEKGVGFAMSVAIDAATTGGVYVGPGTAVKSGVNAGVRGATLDFGARVGLDALGNSWSDDGEAKKDSKKVFGNENAHKIIQSNGSKYNKFATDLAIDLNERLHYKIKLPPKTASQRKEEEISHVGQSIKTHSGKLLGKVKASFSQQAILYNANTAIPSWMLSKGAATNRANALQFYGIAMEMSKYGKEAVMVGKKKMTLSEVSQRAYDYARAAVEVDHRNARAQQAVEAERKRFQEEERRAMHDNRATHSNQQLFANSPYSTMMQPTAAPTNVSSIPGVEPVTHSPSSATSGWGELLDNMGMSGFSDITKNLGYVIAMLPDMMIGMLTGKNPNLKLDDNLMPLAAIVGGMCVKNPILKMLMMGYGGASLFKHAGQAALSQSSNSSATGHKTFKQYDDEALNRRITQPVIKGDTMICNIDGKPLAIKITSDDALDAYEQGSITLNTLANAVLRKYDETTAQVSQSYAMQQKTLEDQQQQRGIK